MSKKKKLKKALKKISSRSCDTCVYRSIEGMKHPCVCCRHAYISQWKVNKELLK